MKGDSFQAEAKAVFQDDRDGCRESEEDRER